MDRVEKEIDKLSSIDLDITIFEPIYKESTEVKRIFKKLMKQLIRKQIGKHIKLWKHLYII